jgi:tellurite resistance protein TehA-like permease
VRAWIEELDPGYFALVMASGIISVGADLAGRPVLSRIALGITAAGFVVLLAAYAARLVLYPARVRASLKVPGTAMGYFTLVAGADVAAVRVLMSGHSAVALGLAAGAGVAWLALTYGLPWSVVVSARHPVLGEINGTWLIWVVATQSLSVVASALTANDPWPPLEPALGPVAVVFWGVGVMLYLVLIAIIFLRLLLVEVTAAEMGPAYWIAMGATAISVRAAAGILAMHDRAGAALEHGLRPFVLGLSVVLWSFGTWWIPLLVLFGVWRHGLRRYPLAYEPRLWSVVFPLGMYTVASYTLGHAGPGLGFMASIARVWVWVGTAAWVGVLGLMAAHHLGSGPQRRRPTGPAVGNA